MDTTHNKFAERFNRTILDDFIREAFRKKFYSSFPNIPVRMHIYGIPSVRCGIAAHYN
jgi:hypothetical protein